MTDNPHSRFPSRTFWLTAAVASIWVNTSEIIRYFAVVKPIISQDLAIVPGIAPINLPIFLSWMVWDTILIAVGVTITWICLERFGRRLSVALWASVMVWASVFVLLWLGSFNMGVASTRLVVIALPLALFEQLVTGVIVWWGMRRFSTSM